MLKNKKPKNYLSSVTDIHKNIIRLKFLGWDISFQWVPSHCGVEGNEIADSIADFGHSHDIIDNYPTELNEVLTSLKKTYSRKWSELWEVDKQTCPLGRYKHTLDPWPHTRHHKRALDVIMTRLRLNHTRLNKHAFTRRQKDSPLCSQCNQNTDENVKHFLLDCSAYNHPRNELRKNLQDLGIQNLSLHTLLGAQEATPDIKSRITLELGRFIEKSGRMEEL